MAMFFHLHLGLVSILIGLLSYGKNGNIPLAVDAVGARITAESPMLRIRSPPPFKLVITDPHVPHYLPCHVDKNTSGVDRLPSHLYTWYHNGRKVHKNTFRPNDFQVFPNGTLKLPPKEKSSGTYQCLVNGTQWNLNATISGESHVEYPVLKRVPLTEANVTVARGSLHVLNCPFDSVPPANVTWFFGNVSIVKKLRENRYLQLSNGSLAIRSITAMDRGKYKCIAENRFATKSHRNFTYNLNVLPQIKDVDLSMDGGDITQSPLLLNQTLYIPEGGLMKLKCDVFAELIDWWFQPDRMDEFMKIVNNSRDLEIRNVQISDCGWYICKTEAEMQQTFKIIITVPPKIETPLKFIESPLAAMFKFNCVATGIPTPKIIWYHNGARLNNSYSVQIVDHILTIHSFDIKDEGIYQCFARNIAGEANSSGLLKRTPHLEFLPYRPDNVQCYPINARKVKISYQSQYLEYMSIHIARENPYAWNSKIPLEIKPHENIILESDIPILDVFAILMRGLIRTAIQMSPTAGRDEKMRQSLLSEPVQCATQGIDIVFKHMLYGVYVSWYLPKVDRNVKYFVVQLISNDSTLTSKFNEIYGTTEPITLTNDDIIQNLVKITSVQEINSIRVLHSKSDKSYEYNDAKENEDYIYNIVFYPNVTGVVIPISTTMQVRVLLITDENEDFDQDLRYVEWHSIKNSISPIRKDTIGSRFVTFLIPDEFNITCINVCYTILLSGNVLMNEGRTCEKVLSPKLFEIRKMKPRSKYRFSFYECKTDGRFNDMELETAPDPPGPVSNQKISRRNGLELTWSPPENPNGKIKYYYVQWTNQDVTYQNNVSTDKSYFKFPNVTVNDKINISIRVVGESGISPPIYIDLRNFNPPRPSKEKQSFLAAHWGPIVGGSTLSIACTVICVFFCIWHKRPIMKRRSAHAMSVQYESDLLNQTPVSYHIGAGNTSELAPSASSQEYYEMQTLIPRNQNAVQNINQRPNGRILPMRTNSADKILTMFNASTPKPDRDFNDMMLDDNPSINFEHLSIGANTKCIPPNQTTRHIKQSSSQILIRNSFNSNKPNNEEDETSHGAKNGHVSTSISTFHPLKHSISTVSETELNTAQNSGKEENIDDHHTPSTSTYSQLEHSNIDRSDSKNCNGMQKTTNYNNNNSYQHLNSDNSSNLTQSDCDDFTATTNLSSTNNLDDISTIVTIPSLTNNTHRKLNWSHRRPIIDPNG